MQVVVGIVRMRGADKVISKKSLSSHEEEARGSLVLLRLMKGKNVMWVKQKRK